MKQCLNKNNQKLLLVDHLNEILNRFNNKINDPRRPQKGKNVAKIIKEFLKIDCPISEAFNKLNFFLKNIKLI